MFYIGSVTQDRIIALVAGAVIGALLCWLLMRSPDPRTSARMEELIRDSAEYADGAQERDRMILEIQEMYRVKDSTLSSARTELDNERRRRRPSAYRDADSLHGAIRKEVGLDPR